MGAGKCGRAQYLLIATLTLLCTGPVRAADDTKAAPQDVAPATRLDEVVMAGKLDSLADIKAALLESENRFNARYNELNKDDDFDIVCRDDTPTGSHVPVRNCHARIVDDQTTQQAKEYFRNIETNGAQAGDAAGAAVRVTPADALRSQAMLEVKERTRALVRSDPELARDLLEHSTLEQMYEERRKESAR